MDARIRKYLNFFTVLLLAIVVYGVFVMFNKRRQLENIPSQDSTVYEQTFEEEPSINADMTFRTSDEQENRIRILKQECSRPGLFTDWIFKNGGTKIKSQYYYSRNFNITYCKVPKTGCTYWKELIFVLERESKLEWKNIFDRGRAAVHILSFRNQFLVPFGSKERIKSTTIIGTRDTYSRLYSAYVDKIYLGGLAQEVSGIANYLKRSASTRKDENGKHCRDAISFTDFLKYIINEVSAGHNLDDHWVPITTICHPCDIEHVLLAKQESFTNDVEEILNVLNVDSKRTTFLKDALHDNKMERTIPALIKDLSPRAQSAFPCLSKRDIAERIWRSMQIQGYIDEAMSFPLNGSQTSNPASPPVLTKVIMDTIKKFPLSSTQSKKQRRNFLVQAYRSVDKDTIKMMQRIYSPDIRLFGYSAEPPS